MPELDTECSFNALFSSKDPVLPWCFLAHASIFKAAPKTSLSVGGLGIAGEKTYILRPHSCSHFSLLEQFESRTSCSMWPRRQGEEDGEVTFGAQKTGLGSVLRLRTPGSCFSELGHERIVPHCSGEIERDSSCKLRFGFPLSCHSAPLGKL